MSMKRRRPTEAPTDEIVDELQAAVDTCACAAETELRQHADGDEMLQLLPDLVEIFKVRHESALAQNV